MAKAKLSLLEAFDATAPRRGGLKQNPAKPIHEMKIPGAERPLRILGNDKDFKKIERMLTRIVETSPSSLENIKCATDAGYTVEFTHVPGAGGECTQDGRFITLAPNCDEKDSIFTLLHEMRHAYQFEHGCDEVFGNRNIKSEIMYTRLTEADANVASVNGVYEMSKGGDKISLNDFVRSHYTVVEPFLAEIEKNPDLINKAKTESLKGFCDGIYVIDFYEKGYITGDMIDSYKNDKADKKKYNINVIPKEAVDLVCHTDNGNYFYGDPDVMGQGKFVQVGEDNKKIWEEYFDWREKQYGLPKDESFKDLPTRSALTRPWIYYDEKDVTFALKPDVGIPKRQQIAAERIKSKKQEQKQPQDAVISKIAQNKGRG
ncbi:MAG: DUF6782 family putative metallopeptidase [Alphaproteobacteria bacterium]